MKILLITILLAIFAYLQEASEYSSEVTNLVHCSTTKGGITLEIYREWSPLGADRFIELVRDGFFQDIAFFRCVDGFLTQCMYHDNYFTLSSFISFFSRNQ